MCFQLMSFKIHLTLENDEFLFQAFFVETQKVGFLEVLFESIVVNVVLVLAVPRLSVTNVTSLMLVSAMGIQFIVAVETFMTKFTFRMTFETTLVDGAWVVIPELFMLP